jgi:hypothetical protein
MLHFLGLATITVACVLGAAFLTILFFGLLELAPYIEPSFSKLGG